MKKNIRNICIVVGFCFCVVIAGIIYLGWEEFKQGMQEGYEHSSQGLVPSPSEQSGTPTPAENTPHTEMNESFLGGDGN